MYPLRGYTPKFAKPNPPKFGSTKVTTVLVIGSALSILTGTLNEIRQADWVGMGWAFWEICFKKDLEVDNQKPP